MEKTKLEVVKKQGFFARMGNFFKNLFSKKEIDLAQTSFREEPNSKEDFKEQMKIEENKEDKEEQELIELQRKYKTGEIPEKDLTYEQIVKLTSLYKRQIDELQLNIEKYKQSIAHE